MLRLSRNNAGSLARRDRDSSRLPGPLSSSNHHQQQALSRSGTPGAPFSRLSRVAENKAAAVAAGADILPPSLMVYSPLHRLNHMKSAAVAGGEQGPKNLARVSRRGNNDRTAMPPMQPKSNRLLVTPMRSPSTRGPVPTAQSERAGKVQPRSAVQRDATIVNPLLRLSGQVSGSTRNPTGR